MESGSRVVRAPKMVAQNPRVRLGPGTVRSAMPGRWRTLQRPCQATLNETLVLRSDLRLERCAVLVFSSGSWGGTSCLLGSLVSIFG